MSFLPENISNFNLISVLNLNWNGFNKDAYGRDYHALSYRTKGDSVFTAKNIEYKVSSGDLVFVPSNLNYNLNAKKESLICIHFTADNLPSNEILALSPSDKKSFETLFNAMYNCWSEKKPGYIAETTSYFYKILAKIQLQQSELPYTENKAIRSALEYIHENFTDYSLSVSKVSEKVFLSESHFRKLFREICGTSPLEYINELRITYALELLGSGYYKICEVAEKCGFSDSKYFSTVIKKKTGLSPKELLNKSNENY